VEREEAPLRVAFRAIPGGWRSYIEYVNMAASSGNAAMGRYMDCYLALTPDQRRHHVPEQLCALAEVAPEELVGAVCQQLWESGIRKLEVKR